MASALETEGVMTKLSIRDLDLAHKHVFMRVDFNVPLTEDGAEITDDTRIKETLPTIEYALKHKAKLILASHLGRPKGKVNSNTACAPSSIACARCSIIAWRKKTNVGFADCIGDIAKEMARQLESGQVSAARKPALPSEEEANDPEVFKEAGLALRPLRERRLRLVRIAPTPPLKASPTS